jgi:hypothetical protein
MLTGRVKLYLSKFMSESWILNHPHVNSRETYIYDHTSYEYLSIHISLILDRVVNLIKVEIF